MLGNSFGHAYVPLSYMYPGGCESRKGACRACRNRYRGVCGKDVPRRKQPEGQDTSGDFSQDYKRFSVNDINFGVGQISSMDEEELMDIRIRLCPTWRSSLQVREST